MKSPLKLSLLFMFMTVICHTGFAQSTQPVSATAAVSATIIAPLAISQLTDMNFGNVAVGSAVGTVVLTSAGGRSVTGSCQLSASNPGTVSAASFAITGQGSYTYGITLPTAATTINYGTSSSMSVDTYVSNPSTPGTLTSGSQTLLVGGTLHVLGSQPAGVYTAATGLTVYVFYN